MSSLVKCLACAQIFPCLKSWMQPPILTQVRWFINPDTPGSRNKKKHRKLWSKDEEEEVTLTTFVLGSKEGWFDKEFWAKLQMDWDFRPSTVYRWWCNRQYQLMVSDQMFIEERHVTLGYELGAAHFLVHRFGAVKFIGQENWIVRDGEKGNDYLSLPSVYDPKYVLEAIDASGTSLMYEGLQNMIELKKLKWLSVADCKYIDDYCLDRISAEYRDTLEYLDVSGCDQLTERGLSAIYRLRNLKVLCMKNLPNVDHLHLVCLMLEEMKPHLQIEVDVDYLDVEILENPPESKFKFIDDPVCGTTRKARKYLVPPRYLPAGRKKQDNEHGNIQKCDNTVQALEPSGSPS